MAVYFTENRISWVYVQSLVHGLVTTPSVWGLGSNGTESALKPSACPQTLFNANILGINIEFSTYQQGD